MTATHGSRQDDAGSRDRLHDIVRDFRVAMLVTHARDGALIARPMRVARLDEEEALYFATGLTSEKVREMGEDPRVVVTFQGKTAHAAVTGHATLSRDRTLIDELWSDAWKPYFPDGKDDPNLVIVVVTPERGEYWDQSGLRGVSFFFRAARAFVTGGHVEPRDEEHGRVELR